ncbi:helicase C-terminal domain-containing protein [Gymnopilus junonius]|uniref:ATP-dependent DNA helicase CHL1 n=1 Tax=Gymnopilus junonius TaxID=109634 RepID=A0A9P5TRA6_GYMJU|nr:helicase C-terminal domain-containing protein [Gymnopilus junonius]
MDLNLPTPDNFPAFPYNPPYDIQTSLMRHLYQSIEDRKVAIVESPTGTGKTLSLLCAALTWLSDEKERSRKGKMKEAAGGHELGSKDWVIEQTVERMRREMEADEREYEKRLAQARKREELMRRAAKGRKGNGSPSDNVSMDEDDDQFLPEIGQEPDEGEMHISPALRALMDKYEVTPSIFQPYSEDGEDITCTKIYYASRTHSQLSQVLPELSRLKLRANISLQNHHDNDVGKFLGQKRRVDESEIEAPEIAPPARAVSLGSRKQLCINDHLRARAHDLDEACRELLGEKAGKRCQYLPPIGEEEKMLDFRDQILASPKDIEELAEAGRLAHTCPYFGSRRAIPQAEVVTLPYNLLLQKSAREALGINLKDQIVLIDEAHNLIPTLLSLSSTRLSYATLSTSFHQVCTYVARFKTRLSPANMLHLKRLVVFLNALKKCVEEWRDARTKEKERTEVMTVAQLMDRLGTKASGINMLEIETYLKKSKVARKIAGYSEKQAEQENGKMSFPGLHTAFLFPLNTGTKRQNRRGAIPPLHMVEDFMISLTNTNTGQQDSVEIKYQQLNPSTNFAEVVEEARSVVLAGGTMSPISDFINQLFPRLPDEKITSFSCGHIIPEENLQTLVIGKGPAGGLLEFKADKQGDPATIAQLGQILLNFTKIIPAGMIVFFPSYKFLNTAKALWTKANTLEKFSAKKDVFFEPEDSAQVETILQQYGIAATKPMEGKKGAILFAVIGAKLSEGLNFADDLARGVVIVGLPFANLGSPELKERLKYVKYLEEQRGMTNRGKGQKDAAAELYENMCMNAVNQSIGRAIRHRNDWASLLLLDRRYATTSIRNKLPKWIGSKLLVTDGFGQTVKEMGSFFRQKKS